MKDNTQKAITFKNFNLVRSIEPPVEKTFDPSVAHEHMLDLYAQVTKEATNRWKRALKDGSLLTTRRNNEK